MKKMLLFLGFVLSFHAAFAAEDIPSAPAPAALQAEAPVVSAPVPRLSAFMNGTTQTEVLKGWPLIVKVIVEHPTPEAPDAKPITLSSKKGDWTKLLRIEVIDKEGSVYLWPFELAPLVKKEPQIILDAKNSAFLAFLLSPEESKRLETGEYKLRAVIRAKKPDGSHFTVSKSPEAALKVSAHPESLSSEQEAAKAKLAALYHALKGDKVEAEKIVAAQPVYVPIQPAPAADGMAVAQPQGYAYVPQAVYAAAPAQPQGGAADILGLLGSFGFDSFGSSYSGFDPAVLVGTGGIDTGDWEDWSSESGMDSSIAEIVDTPAEPEPVIVPPIEANTSEDPAATDPGTVLPTLPPVDTTTPGDITPPEDTPPVVNPVIPPVITDPVVGSPIPDNAGHHTTNAYSGFIGPDMTITADWDAELGGELWVESVWSGESGDLGLTRRPSVEEDSHHAVFKPWDLGGLQKDTQYVVSVSLTPKRDGSSGGAGSFAKGSATIRYSIPGQADQTFNVTLDEEKAEDFWVAFKVDCATGSIEPVGKYATSTQDYFDNGGKDAGESSAAPSDSAVENTDTPSESADVAQTSETQDTPEAEVAASE